MKNHFYVYLCLNLKHDKVVSVYIPESLHYKQEKKCKSETC